jgi:hypothetical protein
VTIWKRAGVLSSGYARVLSIHQCRIPWLNKSQAYQGFEHLPKPLSLIQVSSKYSGDNI